MVVVLVSVLVAGVPSLEPLAAPLAEFPAALVQGEADGVEAGDALLDPSLPAVCGGLRVSTLRAMSGALSALERLQAWARANPQLEPALFGRAGSLAALFEHVSHGQVSPLAGCAAPKLDQGRFTAALGGKLCQLKKPAPPSVRWLANRGTVAAAVTVSKSPSAECSPALSIALFDAKGKARVLLHADLGGGMSAELLGVKCQISLKFDATTGRFQPTWKACKG